MRFHPLRVLIRLGLFLGIVVGSLADSVIRVGGRKGLGTHAARAEWLRRWSRRTLKVLNIHFHFTGVPPRSGLLLSNHLGYLDVIVLASHQPAVFVAKHEVGKWPVIGWCESAGMRLRPVKR